MIKKILAMFALVFAMGASAGTLAGSSHDFSSQGWSNGQMCSACHVPHNAAAVADAPLWSHAQTASTFQTYSSSTSNAIIGQPGATSKLCLSCHDGTVAVNSFGGVTGTEIIGGKKNLGVNLSNDHPVGITYDSALVATDAALHPITSANTIGSGGKTKVGTIESNMLYSGKVECASCHDVHNTFTASGSLVKMTMASSALCTSCHNK